MKEKELLITGAESLRKAALNEDAKAYILNNKPLYNVVKKAANRYIGRETITFIPKKRHRNRTTNQLKFWHYGISLFL